MFLFNAAKVQDIIWIYKAWIFLFQGFLLIYTGKIFLVLNFIWKPSIELLSGTVIYGDDFVNRENSRAFLQIKTTS